MASRTIARLTGTTGTVLVAATMAMIPLAGVASAAPAADRDCTDFASQADAQRFFDTHPGDPDRLDRDHDGKACENQDYGTSGGGQVLPPDPADPGRTAEPDQDDRTGAPAGRGGQVGTTPRGSVDAGDGSLSAAGPLTGEDTAPLVLVAFGTLAAAGAAGAVWSTRRSGRSGR